MKRHDWTSRMFAVIEDHKRREFAWGRNDCCLFVARVVDAMAGSAIEPQLTYGDEAGAMALIASHGGLKQAASVYLGEPVGGRAVRGDPVLIDGGEGDALGICLGAQVVAMGKGGLRYVPRAEILAVWRV